MGWLERRSDAGDGAATPTTTAMSSCVELSSCRAVELPITIAETNRLDDRSCTCCCQAAAIRPSVSHDVRVGRSWRRCQTARQPPTAAPTRWCEVVARARWPVRGGFWCRLVFS